MFDSQLNPAQRISALKSLASEEFDVLIIGGGVTGVGAALDAASRGLKVALVENQDIAAGTSSRSSKLIHGGLRYLEQYDFKLVREALHERELMVSSLAPHLVKPVGFYIRSMKSIANAPMLAPALLSTMCSAVFSAHYLGINI
jgi:glycerol-3-phosphate dehydrogenase